MQLRNFLAPVLALIILMGLTPAALAAPSVSADSAGSKSVGHSTYVWGAVSQSPNRDVWTEVKLGGRWARSQSGRTNGSGQYTLELTYGFTSPGQYQFRVGASTSAGTVYSREFTLTRTAWPVGSAGTKPVGQTTYTWGSLSAAAGRSVWTEVLLGGSWGRSQVRTASSSGYFSIPLTYGASTPGTYTFRVGASTPRGTVYSKPFDLQRTAGSYRVDAYTAGTKEINQTTYTWGTVHGHAGGRVFTQVLLGGSWATSQAGTSSGSGGFSLPLTYGANTPGTYTFRVAAHTPSGTVYSNQFTLTRTAPKTVAPAPSPTPNGIGADLLNAVNRARAAGATCGTTKMAPAKALTWDSLLAKAAQRHSDDMASKDFMSHTGSDGSSMSQRVSDTGYDWRTVGENVAAGHRSVTAVMEAWMKSDGHCRNIMNPNFTEFAAAMTSNDRSTYGMYWTQTFAAPR